MITSLSIIIPAYNEENSILPLLEKIRSLQLMDGIEKEVIIIDDHSSDATEDVINKFIYNHPNFSYYRQDKNIGKGAAVRKGIELAKGDYLIFQDADLELDPTDINALLKKAVDDQLKVVYGSRLLSDDSKSSFVRSSYLANVFLTKLSNMVNGIRITDMETCYKLIDAELAKSIDLKENRFGFEPEITAKLAKKDVKFGEVPITYVSRSKAEGKKIGYADGFRAIYCILRYGLL